MGPDAQAPSSYFDLPTLVSGPVEVRRLQREFGALEDFIRQTEIRAPGKQPALPKISRSLDALALNNKLNLLVQSDRDKLIAFLHDVQDKAPVIHMSFATDPSAAFTVKLVAWLRANIHPYALLRLGLQPNIVAGCVVRTNNKIFDMSLRSHFEAQRQVLLTALTRSETAVAHE